MSERIKGFTIELDLDSIKVDSGLQDVKRSMRLMNSEMKSNMSSFSRSEKSLEKYGVQLAGLNKKYELQEKVVENARKKHDELSKSTTASTKEVEKAATEYNNAKAQLNNLGRYIEGVTNEMNQFKRTQEIQASSLYKTGDALEGFGSGLGRVSEQAKEVGWSLTKKLTLPALGVATAIGGVVASFGWKRLVSIDNAQAQLKGLGYSTKDVSRITDQLSDDLKGGLMTMGEATSAAATAMAAGVKEGAELTRYIQTLDAAAAGSNATTEEMSQIFGRITDQGKLTRNEFDMLSNRMPGFSSAVQEHMGVGSEAMYEMLRNGEITSDDFIDIMEGFSGEMAKEYAKTWDGMVSNTKAYIGILGENLLGGVFDKSKESIAELIDILSSEELAEWAKKAGDSIGNAFSLVVDKIKGAIKWFADLSGTQKKIIGALAGFAVAIGPILITLGTLGGIIGKVAGGLGTFMKVLAPLTVPIKAVGGAVSGVAGSTGFLSTAMTVLTGHIGIAIGIILLLAAGFTFAYKKSDTFRNTIQELGDKIKDAFSSVVQWVQPAIDTVSGFFLLMKRKIQLFIMGEGTQLTQAFTNIKNITIAVFQFMADVVVLAFEKIQSVISFVMPLVEVIIKTVWSGIRNIIVGSLDVIMGAVKIFSGLFTGDFSKMWQGVKQIFSGAINIVKGYIKTTFIGAIIFSIINFVSDFKDRITDMWSNIISKFSEAISSVYSDFKNSFVGKIIFGVIDFVSNFKKNISNMWMAVKIMFFKRIMEVRQGVDNSFVGKILDLIYRLSTDFKGTISDMWNALKVIFFKRIYEVKTGVDNSFVGKILNLIYNLSTNFRKTISDMWNKVKSMFSNFIKSIRSSIENSFVGSMIRSVTNLKDRFTTIASDMWKGVKKQFNNIVDGAKALPGRIGDGIRNARDKATSGMKSVGNSIITWAGKPFNKVVDGVNWVTGKLGIKSKIGKWDYPQYAKGTTAGGHRGGIAMIGEEGRELVQLPTGESFVSPGSHTMLDLPKGTQVTPNKQTEMILKSGIPHYAKGTGGWFSSMKSTIGDVWDYIKNPSKLVNKVIGVISLQKEMAQIPRKIVSGGFNYVKTKPLQYIKDMFKKQEETEHNPNFGGGKPAFNWPVTSPFGYRIHPISGARRLHGGVDFGAPSGSPIPSTTSGRVSSVVRGWGGGFGNHVRVRSGIMEMLYAHMSSIGVKLGQAVKKGQTLGRVGSTGASTGPHLHYETRRNGRLVNPMSLKGFKTGGVIKSKMMAMLGEEGEEIVIPTSKNRRSDAMKLLALAANKIGADSGSYERPSSFSSSRGNDNLSNLLAATLKQNEILMKILRKDTNVYLDSEDVTEKVNENNATSAMLKYI